MRKIKLNRCIVDGEDHHVSEFANLKPKFRPQAFCPVCNSQITLKLSKSRKPVHHAAHKPNSACPLTTPEGILHYNTKLHIFEQLKKGSKLLLSQPCGGWECPPIPPYEGGRCACRGFRSDKKFVWLENWDEVKLEQFVGRRKPDIVIYRQNRAIAAVEIFATHAVDEEKINDYKELGIQWIEVKASENIFFVEDDDYDDSWKIYKPLPFKVCDPEVPKYTCEDCLKAPFRYVETTKAQLEKEKIERLAKEREEKEREEKRLNYFSPHNYIVKAFSLCFLHNDGYCEYHELIEYERCADKSPYEMLEIYIKDGEKGDIIASEDAPITEESKQRLRDNFRMWINRKSSRTIRINVTNSWVRYDEVKELRKTWKPPYIWDKIKMDWVSR